MLASHKKWLAGVGVFFCFCACLAGGIGVVKTIDTIRRCYEGRVPLRTIVVTIDRSGREVLVEQFRAFARQNGFEFRMSAYSSTSNGRDFTVWLSRKDIEMVIGTPLDPGTFKIVVYSNDCIQPLGEAQLDDMISGLELFVRELEGTTFSVRR